MDGHRQRESVTDAALERDLEALLAVEPSVEFMARVRSRVADEPMRARGFSMWRLVLAGVVVAPVVVLFVWWTHRVTPANEAAVRRTERAVIQAVPPVAPAPIAARGDRHPATLLVRRRVVAPPDRSRRMTALTLPDVLIADNEARAYAQLRSDLRNARALPPAPTPGDSVGVDMALEIDPLVIKPIVEVASAE